MIDILGIATLVIFCMVMIGAWLLLRRAPGVDDELRKNRAEVMKGRFK